MENYTPTGSSFNDTISEFDTSDRAHADVLNVQVEALAENTKFLKNKQGDLANLDTKAKESLVAAINEIADGGRHIYGFHISGTEGSPTARVTYLKDAVGMTPAKMNYVSGKFEYGSWEDAFFMPRPCMLKKNGTVDYYLDPDDYTKKEDGVTASDVASISYAGNAMMEWGQNGKKIWMKIEPDSGNIGASVYIADYRVDSEYHDWPFHNYKGDSVDHFYTPIFNGSLDTSGALRSISGQALMKTKQASEEMTAAKKNNPGTDVLWNMETYADALLINMLLTLMAKSTDHQTAFGEGLHTGGSEAINDGFRTGVHNTKGLFFGTNSGAIALNSYGNAVKVFGMENWYGLQWRRYVGHIMDNGVQKVKLTYGTEDGSTATDFNFTGSGYITTAAAAPSGTSGGYISKEYFCDEGMFPVEASGTASTFDCDGLWFNNSIVAVPLRGGASYAGALVGSFYVTLYSAATTAHWHFGAAVSCKPLA
ncbi:MAG: hypothetical protein ILP16_09780 [Spirochaetales bacterium]|nr:hypothetical protein [Spirochaetales bacterium]